MSLFGDMEEMKPTRPEIPEYKGEADELEFLHKEKELVGMYLSSHPLDKYEFEMEKFATCSLDKLSELIIQAEENKTPTLVRIGGYITTTQTITGQSGKPYSKTSIEDFGGNYEFKLYGKDHENFMSYLQPNTAVFIEGKIEESFFGKKDEKDNKPVPYRLKIKNMMLLGNVTESYANSLAIYVTTPMLNDDFREKLVKLIKKNTGSISLSMFLHDPGTGYNIEFASRKFRVSLTNKFLEELKELGINYKISTKTPKWNVS